MWFTSDNAGPAHPKVIEALSRANQGYSASYGADPLTEGVEARLREIFEAPKAAVALVSTGTAANVLALGCITRPWTEIYCHEEAHIEVDEANAPELFTGGAKLTLVGGAHGKIAPRALEAALGRFTGRAVHHPQMGPLSLTQATEAGTVYSLDELHALTAIAKKHDLPVHMDGARFANALERLGCTPAEMTWRAGVDAVSFGGTKNGLLAAEAVILFDPEKAWELELRRKRGAHLFSKHRVLSAQMDAYLEGELWRELAARSNTRAQTLAQELAQVPEAEIAHPVDANMVFVFLSAQAHARAQAAGAKYHGWPQPDGRFLARLVCDWSCTPEAIDGLIDALRG